MSRLTNNINSLDTNISILFNRLAINNRSILYIFKIITLTAEGWGFLLYALILLLFDYKEALDIIKTGIVTYGIYYPTYYLIKNNIKRIRPFEKNKSNIKCLVKPPDKYSLPSGHSAASTIATLIILNFYPQMNFLIIWPILVAFSRIILGVHYFSDAIIGGGLGVICYYLCNIFITANL